MPTLSMPCLCLDLHAYAFFAMFMPRSTCLCLDLCLFGPCVMPMLRFMCLCAPCHICVLRSICWLIMSCASRALLSLDIFSFLCFGPYWWAVNLDLMV